MTVCLNCHWSSFSLLLLLFLLFFSSLVTSLILTSKKGLCPHDHALPPWSAKWEDGKKETFIRWPDDEEFQVKFIIFKIHFLGQTSLIGFLDNLSLLWLVGL